MWKVAEEVTDRDNVKTRVSNADKDEIKSFYGMFWRCVTNGDDLPTSHYRADLNTFPDRMLINTGINHVHIWEGSNLLLYFIETEDTVHLLCISDHWPFDNPGSATENILKEFEGEIERIKAL